LKQKLLTAAKWIWIALVFVVAVVYLKGNYSDIVIQLEQLKWTNVLLSFFLLSLGKIVIVNFSRISLTSSKIVPTFMDMFYVNTVSQLGKYLPGGVWHFVGRFGFYRSREISSKKATKAILLEHAWLISSALFIGISFSLSELLDTFPAYLYWVPGEYLQYLPPLLLIGWIFSVYLLNVILNFKPVQHMRKVIEILITSIVGWLLIGSSFWILIQDSSIEISIWLAISAFCTSWAIGFLTVIAPGGVGIRETILVMFLSSSLTQTAAITYTSIHRLVWIVAELALAGLSIFLFRDKNIFQTARQPEGKIETDRICKE